MSTSAPTSPVPSGVRRLYRSRDDRVVAGVCGGLGRYFDLDPVVVRIVVAALCLLGGAGIVAYLAAWLLVPEEGEAQPLLHGRSSVPLGHWRTIAGGVLLAVAALVIVGSVVPGIDGSLAWPLVLGLVGALLVLSPGREATAEAEPAGSGASAAAEPVAEPHGPPDPGSGDEEPNGRGADDDTPQDRGPGGDEPAPRGPDGETRDDDEPPDGGPGGDEPDHPGPDGGLPDADPPGADDSPTAATLVHEDPAIAVYDADAPTAAVSGFATPAYGGAPDPRTQPTATMPPATPRPRRRRRRSATARIALGVAIVAAAGLGVAAAAAPGDLRWDTALAIVVVVWGVILAGAAFWGRATGLIVLGFVVAAVAALLTGAGLDLRGGVGDKKVTPTGVLPASSTHRLAAGQLRVDLRQAVLRPGTSTVHANVGLGRLVVLVPAKARVVIHATVQAGNLEAVTKFSDGDDLTTNLAVGPLAGPTVVLDAKVGLGSLEIRRGDPPWPARNGGTTSRAAVPQPSLLPAGSHHARA